MSNLDYSFLVEELQPLLGGHMNKIYELGPNLFRFKIRGDKEYNFVAELGLRAHLSKYIEESPETPTNFAMVLRKHLENAVIEEIKQENDDRLLIFTLRKKEEFHLVFEMFAKGNLILTSADYTIIEPYKTENSKARTIKRYESYLAIPNPNRLPERPQKHPEVYYRDGKPVGFATFQSSKFENAQPRPFPTVSEMADDYYPAAYLLKDESEEEEAAESDEESVKKVEFTLKQQNFALKKFEVEALNFQLAGNHVYGNFESVEKIIKLARELKRQLVPDREIEKQIEAELGFKARLTGNMLTYDVAAPEQNGEIEGTSSKSAPYHPPDKALPDAESASEPSEKG
ncbi:MAG TPA: NFACT family protein [Candidatus Norongarragalinales archaeon]|nr:NFACT family protein [Candidatus Norongarragalinales archaeon]